MERRDSSWHEKHIRWIFCNLFLIPISSLVRNCRSLQRNFPSFKSLKSCSSVFLSLPQSCVVCLGMTLVSQALHVSWLIFSLEPRMDSITSTVQAALTDCHDSEACEELIRPVLKHLFDKNISVLKWVTQCGVRDMMGTFLAQKTSPTCYYFFSSDNHLINTNPLLWFMSYLLSCNSGRSTKFL